MEMLENCCLSDHKNSTRTEMLIEKSEEKPDEKPDIKKAKKVRKKRGQYQKASSEQIWTLVYLYYRRHLTIKDAALEVGMKYTTAANHIRKWRNQPIPPWLDEYFEQENFKEIIFKKMPTAFPFF